MSRGCGCGCEGSAGDPRRKEKSPIGRTLQSIYVEFRDITADRKIDQRKETRGNIGIEKMGEELHPETGTQNCQSQPSLILSPSQTPYFIPVSFHQFYVSFSANDNSMDSLSATQKTLGH